MPSRMEAVKRRRSERAMPGRREADVVLLRLLRLEDERRLRRRDERRPRAGLAGRGGAGLRRHRLDELHEPVVVDAPGRGDDHVVRPVAAAVERAERAPRDAGDHVGRAEHRPPQRMPAEHRLRDEVEDELLRRVVDHGDLLEHDLPLGVEVGEAGREDHVRHHVERRLEMLVEDAGVDDGVVAGRRGVQLAAEGVEGLRDLDRGVRRRALEEEVLQEVADAGVRVVLVARAGADPEADRDRAHCGQRLGDDPRAAVERGQQVALHGRIVRITPVCRRRPGPRRHGRGQRAP